MASRKKLDLSKAMGKLFGEDEINNDFRQKDLNENKQHEEVKIAEENVVNRYDGSMQDETIPKEKKVETIVIDREPKEQKETNTANQNLINVKINLIQPNLNQPRKNFDKEKLQELAESISKYGILQPIIVKQNGPLYEIIAGERRWRAAKLAGFEEVPVQLKQFDKKTMRKSKCSRRSTSISNVDK